MESVREHTCCEGGHVRPSMKSLLVSVCAHLCLCGCLMQGFFDGQASFAVHISSTFPFVKVHYAWLFSLVRKYRTKHYWNTVPVLLYGQQLIGYWLTDRKIEEVGEAESVFEYATSSVVNPDVHSFRLRCGHKTGMTFIDLGDKEENWFRNRTSMVLKHHLMAICNTPECYDEWSDEFKLIAKSLFAMQMNWIPQKHFHCISALPQKDQLTSCQWFSRVDEDKAGDHSVMLIEFE